MEKSWDSPREGDAGRRDLLRQGRAVLQSLGEPALAREFDRLAQTAPTRERLVELLLECLLARRLRR